MEIKKENPHKTFEIWVNDFGDDLFSWAFYKTSSKVTAEDLVQDTFLSAFHKIESFEGKSQPKTWLFSILNNKIIDFYRKNAKVNQHEFKISENVANHLSDGFFDELEHWKSMEISAIWDDESKLLDNPEFNNVFSNCIDQLPEKWNFAIQAKYYSDKKAAEICQDLDITVSNYWQIIHRAKLLLKDCLEKNWSLKS